MSVSLKLLLTPVDYRRCDKTIIVLLYEEGLRITQGSCISYIIAKTPPATAHVFGGIAKNPDDS
jgi:hypothetical protein